jgi:hypothetical protein
VAGVDFSYFLIKTELWIVGVIGGWQRRNAISKKISIQERLHTKEIGTDTLGKKIAQTPKYGFVGKITARPSSFKTRK